MSNASAETNPGLPAAKMAAAEAAGRAGWRGSRAGLIWTLVRTDFKVRYHGTIGGFVWALLKPLAMFVMLMGVFSFLFASEPNYKLNLIIGLFLWDFFASGTVAGMGALQSRGFLLTKARCPAWVLIVTSLSNALITYIVFTIILFVFLVFFGHAPSLVGAGLFVLYGVAMSLLVAGFSLAASVLFLRYRDLNQVWDMALQAGFFVAPIIYPIGILPERFHKFLYMWGPTSIIQFSRSVVVDGKIPTLTGHLYLLSAVALAVIVGGLIYRRLGPRAAEYL